MSTTRESRQASNANVVAGIKKDLGSMPTIQLGGTAYTPATLSAVFEDDTAAIVATMAAEKASTQAVQNERAVHAKTAVVLTALKRFLLSYYGQEAVTVLGDFGLEAPRSTAGARSVTTKAVAVAKSKATRVARGTKGPVAKLSTVGSVDATAIEAAINSPAPAPAPTPSGATAAPAATVATPAAQATATAAAPRS